MKFLLSLPIATLLMACSSKPSTEDIQTGLNKELHRICASANASDVKIDQVITPDSSNSNLVKIMFSSVVTVKFGAEVEAAHAHYLKAKPLWDSHFDFVKENQTAEKEIKELEVYIEEFRSTPYNKNLREKYNIPDDTSTEKIYEIINKEIELTSQKIKNLEIKSREQKYTAIKTYAEKTGGILTISETELPTGKIANLNEPKPAEWPNGCSGMYSKNNPVGLLALQNQKESGMIQGDIKRYFSGESGKFTFERMMLKSDKGWVFQ